VSIERRRGPRHALYLPAELVLEGTAPKIAITKDISEVGLLLLTRAKLEAGAAVVLRIYLPGEGLEAVDVPGKVVRREELADEEKGIWRHKLAFSFDQGQPELSAEFEGLAAAQAKLYAASPKSE
jgi:hypothetical protein